MDGAYVFAKDMMLGGFSGILAKTLCAPIERVKIVLQVQASNTQITQATRYNGMTDAVRRIAAEQGLAAFWRGNIANCVRYFPTQAMNFACKERYQKIFVSPREQVGFWWWFGGYLAAGGLSGATSLTVAYPLEFAYTRMAADVGKSSADREFNGIFDCIKKGFQTDGIRGVYRGYVPSVGGIVIYRAGYFGFFDVGKQLAFEDPEKAGVVAKFGLALSVDIAAALFAYPIDTIRRRLMMQTGRAAGETQFTTIAGAAAHIVKNEGFGGFYKGTVANSVRAVASALVLVFYDEFKKLSK